MKSFIVIVQDTPHRHHREYHICPCCFDLFKSVDQNDEAIPEYSSFAEVAAAGWTKTNHPTFCDPAKNFVWICHDCSSNFNRQATGEISEFIEELKKAGEVSYEEMIHIVSEKFSITTNMVVKLAREI